jgi:hypothetical protein
LVGAITNSFIASVSRATISGATPRRSNRLRSVDEKRPGNVADSLANSRIDSKERSFMQWISSGCHGSRLACQSPSRVVGAAFDGAGAMPSRRSNFRVQRKVISVAAPPADPAAPKDRSECGYNADLRDWR